jgi:restriction endonuclease S subunit
MKITEIVELSTGTTFRKKVIPADNGDFWVMESRSANSDGSLNTEELINASSQQLRVPNNYLRNQDILIRGKGNSHQAFLFDYSGEKFPIFPTAYFLVLRLKSTDITSAKFLTWLLNQPQYQDKLKALASGITVQHLTKTTISTLDIDIPSIIKQRRLLALDELIQKEVYLNEKLECLRNESYQSPLLSYLEKAHV